MYVIRLGGIDVEAHHTKYDMLPAHGRTAKNTRHFFFFHPLFGLYCSLDGYFSSHFSPDNVFFTLLAPLFYIVI